MIPSLSVLANTSSSAGGGGGGGGGGATVSIDSRTVSKVGDASTTITVSYTLNSNGNVYDIDGGILEVWRDSGLSSDYEVRATLTGGTAVTGAATGSWLALSTSRTWTLTVAKFNNDTSTLLVEIRSASTLTVLDSATIVLSGENGGV